MRQQVLDIQHVNDEPSIATSVRLARELHPTVGPALMQQGHEAQGPHAQHPLSRAQPRWHADLVGQLRQHRPLVVAGPTAMHLHYRGAFRRRLGALCQRRFQ